MSSPSFLREYLPIFVFIVIAVGFGIVAIAGSWLAAKQRPDPVKLAAYECGFEAFDDARRKFDVRFYLVSILFIIFDLEVAFLFPWAVSLSKIGLFGFWSMMLFPRRADHRFRLRMEKGGSGMGVSRSTIPAAIPPGAAQDALLDSVAGEIQGQGFRRCQAGCAGQLGENRLALAGDVRPSPAAASR